jgi:glycosyltransferase involved in cell wall biosynthesis
MIKIFEIITSVSLGGAENLTINLVDQCSLLHPDKFEFVIVELYASKSLYALRKKVELRSKGVRVITLGGTNKRRSLLLAPFSLWHHIKKEKPQIIHSHTDLPDFVLSAVLKPVSLKNIKIIRTIHNTELWGDHNYIGKLVESSFREDTVIGVSQGALNAYNNLRTKYKLPISSKTSVIYNGCSIPKKDTHHFKLDNQKINIAFCGRFVYQKGVDILVEVIQKLNTRLKDRILFHFVGDGPDKNLFLKLAEHNENVLHYSPVSNLAGKIYGFDFLIMPSRFEGLPLLSIESSLSRVPVIASKAPGLDETLPPDWPLFFSLDNTTEIEIMFQKIMDSIFNIENLETSAFDYVAKKFSMEEMAKAYSTIYLG